MKAVVSDTLPQSVLFGTNVPDLSGLLERWEKALMVVTHSQAQKETPRDRSLEPQEEPKETESSGQSDVWQTEYDFDDDIFVGNQSSKEKKSRSRKRKDRYKHARQKSWLVTSHSMSVEKNSANFRMKIRQF